MAESGVTHATAVSGPGDAWFYVLFIPVAYGTYVFHEVGHLLVGELLGNRMACSLNYTWPITGHYLHPTDDLLVSIGGPAFSILQAVLALWVIEKTGAWRAYPFAFFSAFNRSFSLLLGGFARQDEARISGLLGMETHAVAAVVLVALWAVTVRCSTRLGISLKVNLYAATASTACQLMVIATYELAAR